LIPPLLVRGDCLKFRNIFHYDLTKNQIKILDSNFIKNLKEIKKITLNLWRKNPEPEGFRA